MNRKKNFSRDSGKELHFPLYYAKLYLYPRTKNKQEGFL